MTKCVKCKCDCSIIGVFKNIPNYVCPSCITEERILQEIKNESSGLVEQKQILKCVKCKSTFGLHTYDDELWCPKCLVARIHLLEDWLCCEN